MTRSTRFAGRLFVLLLLASSVALRAGPALASPFTWAGTAGATWDTTATNWTGASGNPWNSVNGLSNEAIIISTNATPIVNGTVYLNKITNSKLTTISSGTLTFGGASPAIVSSDGLTINSTIANVSLLTVSGANISNEKDISLGTGLASFSGTVQALNTTNSKVNLSIERGATLSGLNVIIDSGASLKNTAGSGDTTIGSITVAGVGNANNRGAIRLGNGMLTTTVKLSGSATLGGSGGILAGSIESLATSGTTYTLTLGAQGSGSGGPFPINSQMTDGSTGGKLGLLAAAGTVTLSGTNSYTGGTTVLAGSLVGTTSSLQGRITNNAALTFNQSTSGTYSGVISGSGAFTKLGSGAVTLSGANSYTGVTAINGGVLALGNADALAGTGTISFGGGTLQYSGSNIADYSSRIRNSGSAISIDTNGQSVTFATGLGASNTGGLTKSGLGTLTLSASNGYTGATVINGGKLALGAVNVLPDSTAVTVAGGSVDLGDYTDTVASFTITSGSLSGSGKLTAATYALGGGTVAANVGTGSMTVTANSNLNGTADLTAVNLNSGTLTLGSAGRFTSTQVALTGFSAGSMSLGGNESVGSLAGAFNVALGSATLSTGNDNTSTIYSGIVSGAGGLTKLGTGTFTMSGSSTYSGTTTVTAGTLLLDGRLTNSNVIVQSGAVLGGSGTIVNNVQVLTGGTISPGNSPGILTVGGLDLQSGATALMQITGTAPGTGYDRIVSTGNLDYTGGGLHLQMSGTYADNTVFDLFSAGSVSGTLATISMAGSSDGWQSLAWSAPGVTGPGLYNYGAGVWQSDWTTVGGQSKKLIFNQVSGDLTVVPEPSTFAMAGAGIAALAAIRWRRTRHGRRLEAKPVA